MAWLAEHVKELPDAADFQPGVVYIATGDGWRHAGFKCPCGCEDEISIPLKPQWKQGWTFKEDAHKRVTLAPSLLRRTPCKSHFFLRNGEIEWCSDSPNRGKA